MAAKRKSSRSKKSTTPARRGDLTIIEQKLNTDAGARAAFLKNPVSYMTGQGVSLNPKAKADLKTLVSDMKKSPRFVQGTAQARRLGIGISISISIRIRF
jgi:hypothetical protein